MAFKLADSAFKKRKVQNITKRVLKNYIGAPLVNSS
jgi:hypothetical protein